MKKRIALISAIAMGLISSFANGQQVNVGTRNDGAPYVQIDTQGIPSGFDMDILNAIAEDQDLDLNIRITEFGGLLPGLDSGEFDLVIGGITITDERQAKYDFSEPYIEDHVGIVITNPSLDVSTIDKAANLNLSVERNGIFHRFFEAQGANVIPVDTIFLGIKSVAQGKADGFVSDEIIMAHAIESHTSVDFTLRRLPTEGLLPDNIIGMAVKKGNQDLLDKINKGLENINTNGTYDEIKNKWNIQ